MNSDLIEAHQETSKSNLINENVMLLETVNTLARKLRGKTGEDIEERPWPKNNSEGALSASKPNICRLTRI